MITCTHCNRASSDKEWNDHSRKKAGQPLEATVYETKEEELYDVIFVCPICDSFNSISYTDILDDKFNLIKEY